MSCLPADYDDADPKGPKPERGLLFVYDTKTRTMLHDRIGADETWFWPGGIADAGNGRIIGFRQKDGGVLRIPEQPVDEWLESDWGAESVEEGELAPSGLRRRWR